MRVYAYAALFGWLMIRQCRVVPITEEHGKETLGALPITEERGKETLGAGAGLCLPESWSHTGLGDKGREDGPHCFQAAWPLEP